MSAEYGKLEEDRQEQLDRQPVGTDPYQLSEYRRAIYSHNVMMISGVVSR